jgi:cold shock CspA family protein
LNTFSDRLGTIAQENEGQEVTVFYTQDDKGRTAHDIEPSAEVPV